MKCDECQQDIQGTYYEKDGKNICEKDYEVSQIISFSLDPLKKLIA